MQKPVVPGRSWRTQVTKVAAVFVSTFLITVTKCQPNHLKVGEGLFSSPWEGLHPSWLWAWQQEQEAAGHMVSTIGNERDEC